MEYNDNEFIKLNRKIIRWEWFSDVNTAHFFIYCLITANWKDGNFKGKKIERGQFVRTYSNMSAESGLSLQNIRTAIKHLVSTKEITVNLTGKGRGATLLVTVVKYNEYQQGNTITNTIPNNQLTTNQQPTNNQLTQIEEVKNIRTKEVKKELSYDNSDISGKTHHKKIVDKWNTLKDLGITTLRSITPGSKREINLKSRLKEFGEDSFSEIVDHIQRSKYLQGKVNGWKVDFDWAVLPSNYQKILEGKYDDREEAKKVSFDEEAFLRRFEDE